MESADASGPASLLLPPTSPLLASASYGPNSGSFGNKKAPPPTGNPQSHGSLACTPVSLRPKGHYRSSSLENNPFHLPGAGGAKPQMIGLSIAPTSFTGTLKSRREQKRISDLLSKQSSTGGPSGASLTSGGTARDAASSQSESSLRKAHFENIREIFEKNNSKNAAAQQYPSKAKPATSAAVMTSVAGEPSGGGHSSSLGLPGIGIDDKPPKIQACSGILGKGKQVIRPIAFKPVPYKCNTPNYGAAIGGRLTELSDRYGSTPSLGPSMSMQYKFGSTTDLHHLQQHHHHQQQQQQQQQQQYHYHQGSGGSNGSTPVAVLPPGSMMSNSYHPHYTHHQYGTLTRKGSSIPFKTYDSLESILKLPDSMVASYPNASHGLFHQDMAPSPSDSGISELEAALRDRDSELAYLRQTMEHNEQVIFKVHQDKEKHWEQELNRLKAIHEGRLRAGAQKVHKLEQLLMMQTFQLRQDKKRLQEDNARLQTDIALVKDQNEQHKCELGQAKLSAKDLKEQNGDLLDEIQMLRRVVSDLKERLEESEWNLCQKNGEIALMKTQLKEAQTEMEAKDQDIVQLKADLKLQNFDDISLKKSEIKKELDFDLEISQLNRIVIFKDQIIVLMNNEIQKLRKELSDISILRGYEGAPTGRYTRYRKKLELVAQRFQETAANDDNNNNSSTSNKPIDPPAEADCSESIIRNYFNSKLEMNKKLFLSAPICNYSDEDKSTIIDAYGGGRKPVEMVDITLDLNSLLPNNARLPAESVDEDTVNATHDKYHHQSSSDDDYKSMTPTQEEQEENEQRKPAAGSGKKGTATSGDADALTAEAVERLNRELVCCRESFEQERMKWADEKEKVLVYQRQLQKNYVEMCKRTQNLEQQLKAQQLEATTADTGN
ncbi:leucine zipper putative tumor suppressor 3 [Anopheles bellator]|uniref:leucine zipper putative tumor suppressor 3 n=1 Tax=Anopheles bellator TaxID=139047 RepID=UPI0026492036|nr:leucine zipper putative tumor suppressor 3 [Anopheles bellator]